MNWSLLGNSLLVSALATLLAVALGFVAALFLGGLEWRWRRWWLGAAALALALPPFLVTGCWLHLLGLTGVWRRWLPFDIYSRSGAVWILALLLWPISLLLVLSAWQRLEPGQIENEPALTGGPLIRWLLAPLAANALAQSAVVTFVLALNNFAVPALLQVKVFPVEVWIEFNDNLKTGAAFLNSWPLLLAPVLLLFALSRREIPWPRLDGAVSPRVFRRQLGRGWFRLSAALAVLVTGLSVGLPLADLCLSSRTWLELSPALKAGQAAALNSALFSMGSAALIAGIALATWRWPIGFFTWIPFLVPGVLLGIALIHVFNRPVLSLIYHSTAIVFLAWTTRYLAVGWNTIAHALRSVDPDLTDAARLEGASARQVLRYVRWPQAAASVAAGGYLAYLFCLWDAETLILIMPPGAETLALRIFNLLHYGHNAQVNALCLILLMLALAPLVFLGLIEMGRQRFRTASIHLTSPGGGFGLPVNRRFGVPALGGGSDRFEPPKGGTPNERPGSGSQCMRKGERGLPMDRASQIRMTNDKIRRNDKIQMSKAETAPRRIFRHLGFGFVSSFGIRHSAFRHCGSWPLGERRSLWKLCKNPLLPVALVAMFAGCSPANPPNAAPVESRIFSRVEIIGTRGAGIGEFNKPRSVAVDAQDNLYVVDMTGRVQKFSPNGAFLSFWQMPQTDKGKPKGMCRDLKGDIVVLEPHYSRVNHFTPDGKLVAQWGVHGTNSGELAFPRSVIVNSIGDIFVSEYGLAERVQEFTAEGKKLVRAIDGRGRSDGGFNRAEGLGIDAQDRLYVADSCNHRIEVFSPDGQLIDAYGRPGTGRGEFSYPYDIKVDAQGLQFVCEFGNSRIQVFDRNHQPLEILGGPGAAPGQFSNPWGLALDSKGNLYVADAMNHRVQKLIRRDGARQGGQGQRAKGKAQNAGIRIQAAERRVLKSEGGEDWLSGTCRLPVVRLSAVDQAPPLPAGQWLFECLFASAPQAIGLSLSQRLAGGRKTVSPEPTHN